MSRRNVERDDAILDLTGQFGIGLRIVYERLWFPKRNMGNAIQQLLREGRLLSKTEGLPGNRSYYQLSPKENAVRGFPSSHATPLGESRLQERLATLWFSTMGKHRRSPVSAKEIRDELGQEFPSNNNYCIEPKAKGFVMLRLRQTGERMEPVDVMRWLYTQLDEIRDSPLDQWRELRRFGYALLVDDPSLDQSRVQAIKRAVKESGIEKKLVVRVEFAPSPTSLGFACQQWRNWSQSKLKGKK